MLGLWLVAFELQSAAPAAPIPEHWTQFRGPHQNGSLDVDSIPLVWSSDSNILWKAEIEGGGNSSPVIWGDKLFLTSATIEGGRVKETAVMALDCRSGKQLWRTPIPIMSLPGKTPSSENGWATPTPACDSTNLVVVFATGTIACLDHDGRLRWNQDLGPLQHLWGLAASPVLDASRVYYSVDQGSLCGQPSHLTAIDVRSGQTLWRTNIAPSVGRGYSTPLLVSSGARTELVLWARSQITGYDPVTGRPLWTLATFGEKEPIATPAWSDDTLYLGQSDRLLAYRISRRDDGSTSAPLWTLDQNKGAHVARIAGYVVYRDHIYGVSNEGVAWCHDTRTGRKIWDEPLHDEFYAAPVAAAGHVIYASRSGKFHVLKAGDQFACIATNNLAERCDVSPVVAPGRLYLRSKLGSNRTTIWCVGK
ncbi:MAG TPA: PQQ-binding-like beta-propeller repeat protein [Verrucomicrobiae bacterium]|nr:PQQ-binding-like beta-propeller repeat protein [Verrucomicrobiae bacterium]